MNSQISSEKQASALSSASSNELLKELLSVPSIAATLVPELRLVSLSVNQVLYEQGDKIESIYFPLDSVVSELGIMEDGTTVETSMVGRDSLVGISTILGNGQSRQWIWVTVAGSAIQIDTKLLDQLFVSNEHALMVLLKAYRSLVAQLSYRAMCNSRHTILERLCLWLLMIHDRVGDSNLNLTQEMIASRVGARRAGITVAAGSLQSMKAIGYRRGHLHIQDRGVLEQTVCECYQLMTGAVLAPQDQSTLSL